MATRRSAAIRLPRPPEDELIALRVERVENGEVSPYLVEELRSGDQFELRGPIGGYFVRTAAMSDPLCLIAAGSGIAPLMAMLRHRDRRNSRVPAVLLHSSRNLEDVIYRKELDAMARRDPDLRVVNTLTRKQPEGCQRDLLVPLVIISALITPSRATSSLSFTILSLSRITFASGTASVGSLQLHHVACDALVDPFKTPLHLGLGEVLIARIDSLEFGTIDGNARLAQ
jgi:Oxidoreductase NAD-binding domain